jgi:hypothetical protein
MGIASDAADPVASPEATDTPAPDADASETPAATETPAPDKPADE